MVSPVGFSAREASLTGKGMFSRGRRIKGLTFHVYACNLSTMKLLSLPCYCATLRQAARAVTVLYEDMLADSALHATQYTALQLLELAANLTTTELAEGSRYRPDHGHADLGVDQEGWLCSGYRGS